MANSPEVKARLKEEHRSPHAKVEKIWLPEKREIAKSLGYEPDTVTVTERRAVDSEYKKRHKDSRRWG